VEGSNSGSSCPIHHLGSANALAKDESSSGQGAQPGPGPGASEPFRADCRASRLSGIEGFAECLTLCSANCKFLFTYGQGHFCTHPKREEIVARTQRQDPSA
jgi:hypothetical protein